MRIQRSFGIQKMNQHRLTKSQHSTVLGWNENHVHQDGCGNYDPHSTLYTLYIHTHIKEETGMKTETPQWSLHISRWICRVLEHVPSRCTAHGVNKPAKITHWNVTLTRRPRWAFVPDYSAVRKLQKRKTHMQWANKRVSDVHVCQCRIMWHDV